MGKYEEPLTNDVHGLRLIANELADANRLKKLEIIYAGRAGNMTEETVKKLIDILNDSDDNNLDLYGDYEE